MYKFDTKEATLKALTKNKRDECIAALTDLFNIGLSQGLANREAYYYAETVHYLADHGGAKKDIAVAFEPTDENARQTYRDIANEDTSGDREKVLAVAELFIKWYDLFRSWGAGVGLAYTSALPAVMEEWEHAHDIPEDKALAKLNQWPGDPNNRSHEKIKKAMFDAFYEARADGESVLSSLEIAIETAKEAMNELLMAQSLIKSLLSGRGGPKLPN